MFCWYGRVEGGGGLNFVVGSAAAVCLPQVTAIRLLAIISSQWWQYCALSCTFVGRTSSCSGLAAGSCIVLCVSVKCYAICYFCMCCFMLEDGGASTMCLKNCWMTALLAAGSCAACSVLKRSVGVWREWCRHVRVMCFAAVGFTGE